MLDAARASRMAALRPVPIAVEPEPVDDPRHNEAHLAHIRSMRCAVVGCVSPGHGAIVPHHVRENTGGGTGLKPGDEWTVPLCGGLAGHHVLGHRIGWDTFQIRYSIDLRKRAIELAIASPHISEEIKQAMRLELERVNADV